MHLQPQPAPRPDAQSASRLSGLPRQLAGLVTAWSVQSQQQARRNAMIASTALAQRRAEREAVEDFLARRAGLVPDEDTADPTPARPASSDTLSR